MLSIRLIFIAIFSFSHAFGKSNYEEIKTKQAINNIRFISDDGKTTYFKNQSGSLKYSSNYQVQEIIKADQYADYTVSASPTGKMVAIEKKINPHRYNWFFKPAEILIAKMRAVETTKIGNGLKPRFHQNDQFISYFDPLNSEIIIKNLKNLKKKYSIKVSNRINPYFIPDVHMITPNDVVYTDVNSKGFSAVLMYSILDKAFETIYKSQDTGKKLEVCLNDDAAIIGEFPYELLGKNSSLTKIPLFNNAKFQNAEILYTSPFADMGNMICQKDKIYFIKTSEYQRNIHMKKTDIASFNLKNNIAQKVSDLGDVTQIISMGKMILTPYKGKLLVVVGNNEIVDDTIKRNRQ